MTFQDPLISIVIPTYNQAFLLERAIKSVLSQSFNQWEIIIINNFSQDNTISIINSFKDKRIKIFNLSNNGIIAKSRNFGILKSRSKYIAFLDSDDYWYPEKLSKVYAELKNGYEMVSHNENWFRYERFLFKKKYKPKYKLDYSKLLFKGNCFSTSAITVLKSKLEEINGFDESKIIVGVEDYDLWLRLVKNNIKFTFLDDALGIYYLYNNNFSKSLLRRFCSEFIAISKHVFKLNLKNPNTILNYIKRIIRLILSCIKGILN